jgi:hypothetical protein
MSKYMRTRLIKQALLIGGYSAVCLLIGVPWWTLPFAALIFVVCWREERPKQDELNHPEEWLVGQDKRA